MSRVSPTGILSIDSIQIRSLIAIAFVFPIALSGLFFPTPAADLREHIAFGLNYRLYVYYAPPLQTWIAGAVALTGARDAWLFVATAQVLNFIGLGYLVLIARRFFAPGLAVPLVVLFCGSLYFSAATPSMALNSDQIQVPLWAGIVFHGLTALHDNRWRHWIACGALVGLTVIAKYSALLFLASILVALALVPAYRGVFANPRLYVAALVSLPIVALHVVPELSRGYSVGYAAGQFWVPAVRRFEMLWNVARSYAVYGLPFLIGLAELARRKAITVQPLPKQPAARFILLLVGFYFATLAVMILAFGFYYATRYTYPILGLSLLALLSAIRIEPQATRPFATIMLAIWACIIVGALIYSQVAIHRVQREPAPAAANALRQTWDAQFACGPAYVIGSEASARGVAIYYGKPVVGLIFEHTGRPDWLDKDRLSQAGAIVVTTPEQTTRPDLAAWFKDRSTETLSFPYRRTFRSDRHTYVYYFIPPQDCSDGASATVAK